MKKLKQAAEKEKKQEQNEKSSQYQEALPAVLYTTANFAPEYEYSTVYATSAIPAVITRSFSIFQPPRHV